MMLNIPTIIMLYVSQIIDGDWEWDNVPVVIRPQVEELYYDITGEKPNYKK